MQYHELVFSAAAATRLKKGYGKLLHKLNLGKTLDAAYLAALTLAMREQLYAQKKLTAFWQKAAAAPESTHHLHLVHRDKELLNLPWQMAIDGDKHPSVYISKGFIAEQPSAVYTPQAGPLKILIMISSPEDEQAYKRLSFEKEEEVLLEALRPMYESDQVEVSFTITGSLESLEASLAKEHFHLLYFSGHGGYKHKKGYLLLEEEKTMKGIEVSADLFAAAVCKYPSHIPALVILASCQSAEGDVEEGFPGIADELMAAGVPAVIAMAFSIPDEYVTIFATHLFEAFGQRETLLTAYVKALHGLENAEATYAMEEDYNLAPTQWLVPQLYFKEPVEHIVQWTGRKKKTQKKRLNATGEYRFIGRRRELSRLLPFLYEGKPVLLLGQAGVGKTALAEKAVQRLLAADSKRVQFRFESRDLSAGAIKTHLEAFLSHTGELEYLLGIVRKKFRPLWVIDDMDVMQSAPGGALRDNTWLNWLQQEVIPYDPVLFISRYNVPELANVQVLAVNEASSGDLFTHLMQLEAAAILITQPHADPLVITEIVYNALGGHYMAWACFNRLYRQAPGTLWKIIEKIWSAKDPSNTMHLYNKITEKVQEEMDKEGRSVNLNQPGALLEEADWQTLQLLAHFRTPVPLQALEMQPVTIDWQPVLSKLRGLSLVEEHLQVTQPAYGVTRLVNVWLQQQERGEISFSAKQAGDYYYAREKETEELIDLIEAFWHYLPEQHAERINETGLKLARAYYDKGTYDQALHYALHTLTTCGDSTYPEVLNIIAAVYRRQGALPEAIKFWTAFYDAAINTGNRVQEGLALNNLAALLHELSETEDAKTMMERSLAIARETNDQREVASRLNSLGKIVEGQHDHVRARALYEESLQLWKEMDDVVGEAQTLMNLTDAFAHTGEVEKAQLSLRFCITIFKEAGEIDSEATAYEKLGELLLACGEQEEALDLLHKSLQLYSSLRSRGDQSRVLDLIGQLYTGMSYFDQALAYLTKSLAFARQLQQRYTEIPMLIHLSNLYRVKGEPDKGISYAKEAMIISREEEDKEAEADCLFQLGYLYLEKGDRERSVRYFKQSKKLMETFGTAARQDLLDAIAHHISPPEDFATRLSLLEKQLVDCRKQGKKLYEADILYLMAEIALQAEKGEAFFEWADEAYDIYTQLEHMPGIFRTGCLLGNILYLNEDPEDRAEGLELLQLSFQIGQKEGYPGTEDIAAFIKGELS
ncbi:tetratricopeptide repeat protein [Chitinophaga niabensis]|uniref:ATPase n=1 Tax=Chitinophaga niabensis TaxID=536979 RepID=A0A1N6JNS1_9BACT|nr:tetratricopeptide repeat protein [Chitinophaga niabensis]SIO46044.1 ATPase [Chitinophaga niabensis]